MIEFYFPCLLPLMSQLTIVASEMFGTTPITSRCIKSRMHPCNLLSQTFFADRGLPFLFHKFLAVQYIAVSLQQLLLQYFDLFWLPTKIADRYILLGPFHLTFSTPALVIGYSILREKATLPNMCLELIVLPHFLFESEVLAELPRGSVGGRG